MKHLHLTAFAFLLAGCASTDCQKDTHAQSEGAAKRDARTAENSSLLLRQLEQEDYYYPLRQTNALENMRLNLRNSEEIERLNEDTRSSEGRDCF